MLHAFCSRPERTWIRSFPESNGIASKRVDASWYLRKDCLKLRQQARHGCCCRHGESSFFEIESGGPRRRCRELPSRTSVYVEEAKVSICGRSRARTASSKSSLQSRVQLVAIGQAFRNHPSLPRTRLNWSGALARDDRESPPGPDQLRVLDGGA